MGSSFLMAFGLFSLLGNPMFFAVFKRSLYWKAVGVTLFITNIIFIIFFNENLHCTQYVNVFNSFFDFSPHPEEIPIPASFSLLYGIPIRFFSMLLMLAIMFYPAYLFWNKIINFTKFLSRIAVIIILVLMYLSFPFDVVGERLHYIIYYASVINASLLAVYSVVYLLSPIPVSVFKYLFKKSN